MRKNIFQQRFKLARVRNLKTEYELFVLFSEVAAKAGCDQEGCRDVRAHFASLDARLQGPAVWPIRRGQFPLCLKTFKILNFATNVQKYRLSKTSPVNLLSGFLIYARGSLFHETREMLPNSAVVNKIRAIEPYVEIFLALLRGPREHQARVLSVRRVADVEGSNRTILGSPRGLVRAGVSSPGDRGA